MSRKPLAIKKIYNTIKELASEPVIVAASQIFPLAGAITAYLSGEYQREQFNNLELLLAKINARLQKNETTDLDSEFLESANGKRVIGKIFRSIIRDNRVEKIEAMANLTVNLFRKSKIIIDERELYVDILDKLNTLQLSILSRVMVEVKSRTTEIHKGFSWEKLSDEYSKSGVTKAIFLQSLKVLESNGLINENNAVSIPEDRSHFVTFFCEQFHSFVYETNLESLSKKQ